MSTDQQTRPDTTPVTSHGEPGDHERMAHYVTKESLEKAIFEGVPTRALCGKMWLPTRDPKGFPVCPECKEAWEGLRDDSGDQPHGG